MRFENRVRVATDPQTLWAFLMDIPSMAGCVPGVEEVVADGDERYRGTMRVRLGPISLRFAGAVTIVERDPIGLRAGMLAEGTDRAAGGGVKAHIDMSLEPASDDETELVVVTTADVLGRIGQFGQPVMRAKADAIMREFATNVTQRVRETAPGVAVPPE